MQTILLPEKVSRILSTLSGAGFEAYAVGGCVRDAILSGPGGDIPLKVEEGLCRRLPAGKRVRALTARHFIIGCEVADDAP